MRKSFEYDYELLHSKYTLMYNYIFTQIFSIFTSNINIQYKMNIYQTNTFGKKVEDEK
jgi:hypothetical protein